MSKQKKESFFWVSYSDMMTSLFFIMLILFVLSVAGMYIKGKANEEELKNIHELEEAVDRLPENYFIPDSVNKRWVLKAAFMPQFATKDSIIPVKDEPKLLKVGREIENVIMNLSSMKFDKRYANMDVKYMVVIEGMASNIAYSKNDELSYKRALALYYLWKRNNIDFESSNCEVQISGSGVRGIRLFNTNPDKFDLKEEEKNQCIIIQIIPKISMTKKARK